MFHILGFLFIIIIAILLIGLSIIGTVIRNIFGLGGRRTSSNSGPYQKGMVITSREGIPTMIIDNRLKRYKLKKVKYAPATRNCSPKTRESMWILKKLKSRD